MTVYVDTMRAQYRRMVMCHMVASNDEELHEMAERIGVARKWYQGDHYDICLAKRAQAIKRGAVEITMRECAMMVSMRKRTGRLGNPIEARAWFKAMHDEIRCLEKQLFGHEEVK